MVINQNSQLREYSFNQNSLLRSDNIIVHSLWIGERLSLMECLTIKLLQKHGHQVHLWAYQDIANVPEGVIIRNASEILSEESIFRFTGTPLSAIPNGGIGSLSHWSDRFQMRLLELEGGIYTQLDVAYLQSLNFRNDYLFVPHVPGENSRRGVAAFLMKCPKGSSFTSECFKELEKHINSETISGLHWDCSMIKIYDNLKRNILNYDRFFIEPKYFLDLGCLTNGPFFENVKLPEDVFIIHWSNATHHERKDNPIPGSVYDKLLKEVGL